MSALSAGGPRAAADRASRRSFTTPAATATCSACSRTCSARTPWGSGTCCSSPAIRRRPGTIPTRTAVFDVDSIGLTNVVSRLNRGLDIGGQPIGAPTAFHIGVAVNPGALEPRGRNPPLRIQGRSGRGVRDHAAGVRRGRAVGLPRAGRRTFGSRSSPAIAPLESLRHAEFMANEVPGVRVPDAIVERMRRGRRGGARRRRRAEYRVRDRRRRAPAGAGRADFAGRRRLAQRLRGHE